MVVVRDGSEMRLNARIARLEDETPAKVADAQEKGQLGLSVQPITPPVARELGLKVKEGVLVRDVVEGGRAAEAGIRPGDVIVEINRQPVRTVEDLKVRVDNQAKNEPIVLLVNRDGQALYLAIPARTGVARGSGRRLPAPPPARALAPLSRSARLPASRGWPFDSRAPRLSPYR
jgi:serine protease Do